MAIRILGVCDSGGDLYRLRVVLRAHNELPKETRPFPGVRLMIIAVGVTLIALAGVEPHPLWSTLACLSALVVFALFLWVDARKPAVRMFPSTPWDIRRPLGAGFALFLFGFCSTMSFLVYGPLLLEVLHGISPLKAGYILALESVAWSLLWSARCQHRPRALADSNRTHCDHRRSCRICLVHA